MTLDEAILKRRSIRSYDMEELEPEIIDGLVDFLSELKVPDDTIDWTICGISSTAFPVSRRPTIW